MLLLRAEMLPDDAGRWEYQLKCDGCRAIAFETGGILYLRSDARFAALLERVGLPR